MFSKLYLLRSIDCLQKRNFRVKNVCFVKIKLFTNLSIVDCMKFSLSTLKGGCTQIWGVTIPFKVDMEGKFLFSDMKKVQEKLERLPLTIYCSGGK